MEGRRTVHGQGTSPPGKLPPRLVQTRPVDEPPTLNHWPPAAAPVDLGPWSVVHDFTFVHGGAEWVTEVLCKEALPESRLYYIAGTPEIAGQLNPRQATRLAPFDISEPLYRYLSPLYPSLLGARRPLGDNILASSYAFAHHVPTRGKKVVYCHSPFRQAWSGQEAYRSHGPVAQRAAVKMLGGHFQARDLGAARSADLFIATSKAVQQRISTFYGRQDVPLIPPPVDNKTFRLAETPRGRGYLWVGRITEPYKRLSLLIEAFRHLPGRTLTVVGDGPDRARLQAAASSNVTFLGWRSKEELATLYQGSAGLLFPGEDDFGIVPVEAMACGTPTLAFAAGGALDTITEYGSGLYFREPTVRSFKTALIEFEKQSWAPRTVAEFAVPYSVETFSTRIRQALASVLDRD